MPTHIQFFRHCRDISVTFPSKNKVKPLGRDIFRCWESMKIFVLVLAANNREIAVLCSNLPHLYITVRDNKLGLDFSVWDIEMGIDIFIDLTN